MTIEEVGKFLDSKKVLIRTAMHCVSIVKLTFVDESSPRQLEGAG